MAKTKSVDTSLLTKSSLGGNTWFSKESNVTADPLKFQSDLFREFIAWVGNTYPKYTIVMSVLNQHVRSIEVYAPTPDGNELLGTVTSKLRTQRNKNWAYEGIVSFRNRRIDEDISRGTAKETASLSRAKLLFRKYFYSRSLVEILHQSMETSRYYNLHSMLPNEKDVTPYALVRNPALWKFLLDHEDEIAAAFDNPADVREAFATYRTGEASNAKLQEFKDTHVVVVPYGDKYLVADAHHKDVALRTYEELPDAVQARYSILAMRNSSCETASPNYVSGLGITNGAAYLVATQESNDE